MSQWKFLILRNLAGIASMLLTFYAIKYLPISIAILLMNTSALLCPLLLFSFKVRTPLKVLACSFYGVYQCVHHYADQRLNEYQPYPYGYALGAAVLAAMAFISLQELNEHNSPKNIVFYFHLLGSILCHSFYYSMGNTNTTWIHTLLLVGGFGLIFNYYSLAPLNTRLPMSLRLLLLPVSFFPVSVTGYSGITYQA